MNGILVINKEIGCTSRDVVNQVCKILNTKKIGHTGTLDPIASGVLVLCIGKYTKLVDFITSKEKEYIASFKLGIKTDTLDITGNVLEEKETNISKEQILEVINKFPKKYNQEVPIYSAVKINGKKLYQYARNNEKVELPSREVEIKEIELLDYKDNIVTFRVLVSKGTYIRSLIKDICEELNTIGTMTSLIRTKQGFFSVENSFTVNDVQNNKCDYVNLEELFKEYEKRELDEETYKKIINGVLIDYDFKDYLIFTYKNEYIAIYEQYKKYSKLAKPLIIF